MNLQIYTLKNKVNFRNFEKMRNWRKSLNFEIFLDEKTYLKMSEFYVKNIKFSSPWGTPRETFSKLGFLKINSQNK